MAYFEARTELIEFFLENRGVFITVSTHWLHHVMGMKQPSPKRLLPGYLCPFDASDPDFTSTTYYKTTKNKDGVTVTKQWEQTSSHFDSHFRLAESNELHCLISCLLKIQKLYFKHDQVLVQDWGGKPILLHRQTLFQPSTDTPKTTNNRIEHCRSLSL